MTVGLLNSQTGRFVDMVNPVNRLCPWNRGLVSWWLALPGTTGSARFMDIMNPGPHGNHGTLTSMDPATDWKGTNRPGGFGELDYDGVNKHVDAGNPTNIQTIADEITVSAWMNIGSTARGDAVSQWGSANQHFLLTHGLPAGKAEFFISKTGGAAKTSGDSSQTIAAGEWHCLTGRYTGAAIEIYVDGELGSSTAESGAMHTTSSRNVTIGESGDDNYLGQIDDVRIHNRALSANELKLMYLDSLKGYPDTLNWIEEPAVTFVAAVGGAVPALDEGMLTGGLQPLGGGVA